MTRAAPQAPVRRLPHAAKPVHFAGRDYPSISALAAHLGVARHTARAHVKRGDPIEFVGSKRGIAVHVPELARSFASLAAAARACRVSTTVMRSWLAAGCVMPADPTQTALISASEGQTARAVADKG
jgi:hypothetical protein